MLTLHQLLEDMIEKNASDLHITAGVPPQMRVDGEIVPTGHDPLTPEQCETLIYSVLRDDQKKRFEMSKELDLSFGVQGLSRFRVNVFSQRGCHDRRDPQDSLPDSRLRRAGSAARRAQRSPICRTDSFWSPARRAAGSRRRWPP